MEFLLASIPIGKIQNLSLEAAPLNAPLIRVYNDSVFLQILECQGMFV